MTTVTQLSKTLPIACVYGPGAWQAKSLVLLVEAVTTAGVDRRVMVQASTLARHSWGYQFREPPIWVRENNTWLLFATAPL